MQEAVSSLEAVDHDFYIYLDADSQHVQVVYKRNEGGHGACYCLSQAVLRVNATGAMTLQLAAAAIICAPEDMTRSCHDVVHMRVRESLTHSARARWTARQ